MKDSRLQDHMESVFCLISNGRRSKTAVSWPAFYFWACFFKVAKNTVFHFITRGEMQFAEFELKYICSVQTIYFKQTEEV